MRRDQFRASVQSREAAAVQQPAVPKAAKQSTVPLGRRLGGDGAESGATVNVGGWGLVVRVLMVRGCTVQAHHCTTFELR